MYARHNITLDEEISRELELVSEEMDEKKSSIVSKALTVYFDLLDLNIARKRLNELKNGKAEAIGAEDVWKELKL